MFQFEFGRPLHPTGATIQSRVSAGAIDRLGWAFWEEHCLECAQPDCYRSCSLYRRRADANCARFEGGIQRNTAYAGPAGCGAEIRFRKWGKLQSRVSRRGMSIAEYRRFQRIDVPLAGFAVNADIVSKYAGHNRNLKPHKYYNYLREQVLQRRLAHADVFSPDAFILEAWNLGPTPFNLCLELRSGGELLHREAFKLNVGHNVAKSTSTALALPAAGGIALASIYPENDFTGHVVFTWLDFVRFRQDATLPAEFMSEASLPAPKVKCVVWDLDNTLWSGVVGDDGVEAVVPRPESVKLVHDLDARGILQSIASKNSRDIAIEALRRHGLLDYFLYPEIHWDAKSGSLQRIARNLNIGIDSFAFIDDSAFERGEVADSIPGVRVYDLPDIPRILGYEPFDVPQTAEAATRRLLYAVESKRQAALESEGGDVSAFLRRCNMTLRIGRTFDESEIERCAELLQRTNQLNLSGRRLSQESIAGMIADENTQCLRLHCGDAYGDYGLVGFVAISTIDGRYVMTDMAMSCRVAAKKVENALAAYLQAHARSLGMTAVEAAYVATSRNAVLLAALENAGFRSGLNQAGQLVLPQEVQVPDFDIVRVVVDG